MWIFFCAELLSCSYLFPLFEATVLSCSPSSICLGGTKGGNQIPALAICAQPSVLKSADKSCFIFIHGELCLVLPFWFLYQIKTEAKWEICATFAKVRRERQPARSLFIHCSKSLGNKDKSQFLEPRIGWWIPWWIESESFIHLYLF